MMLRSHYQVGIALVILFLAIGSQLRPSAFAQPSPMEMRNQKGAGLLFPSLLRQLAESEQRAYHFAYSLNMYAPPEAPGSKQVPVSKQNVQEWFSYELAMQTIARSFERLPNTTGPPVELSGEKYLRLYNLMPNSSVNYKIVFSSDAREPFRCEFGSLDEDPSLAGGSKLLRRPMEFHQRAVEARHRGELIGLGALLMNIADIHHKRAHELQHEVRLGARNNYQTHVEWQVEDFANTGQRWFLYFRKPTLRQLAEHESSVADLTRVELRHRRTGQKSGDIEEAGAAADSFYGLVMEIEVNDFTNSLYQDELDRAFRVPPICPEAEDAQVDESLVTRAPSIDVPSQEQEPEKAALEDLIQFPSFDELIGLDQNYKISSRWKFLTLNSEVDTELRVTEYFNLELQPAGRSEQQLERSLFSRLDVAFMEPETGVERARTRYFLYHSINLIMMCRDSQERCSQIYSLDDWLMVVSSQMAFQFDSIQIDKSGHKLRHFGLGALWSLASGTELAESRPEKEDNELVWRLEASLGGLFDKEAKILFRFATERPMRVSPINGAVELPLLALSSLTIDSGKFRDFTQSGGHLLKIDEVVVQPNAAQPDDFNLPDYCRETQNFASLNRDVCPLVSYELEERRANFLTLPHAFGLDEEANPNLRDLEFKLTYDLIVSSGPTERRFRVTEMNSPRSSRALIRLEMQDLAHQSFRLWLLERDVRLLEQVKHSDCKQAPALEDLFQLDDYLNMIGTSKEGPKMDSLIAHLWHAFGRRALDIYPSNKTDGELIMSKQSAVFAGKHLRTTRWSLFDSNSNLIIFEFTQPEESEQEGALKLNSISLIPSGHKRGPTLRFMMSSFGKLEKDDEAHMELPPVCEQASREGAKLPKLSKLLGPGDRMHMRSELALSESQIGIDSGLEEGVKRVYMLDEWLQLGRAYRAKLSSVGRPSGTEGESKADYLMDFTTSEYFDLSLNGRCKVSSVDGERGLEHVQDDAIKSLNLKDDAQMLAQLFHSKSSVFYGPLSVWMLAEYLNGTALGNDSQRPLNLLDLFDSTSLDRWFATSLWLLEHPHKSELNMRVLFEDLIDVGRHSIALQSVVSSNWHANEPGVGHFLAQTVSYNFELALNASQPEVDEIFRVPKGFGCKRSDKAKRKFTSKDVIVFNELSPFEFEYEASLKAIPEGQNVSSSLEPLPVIQSGWFGRCPGTWDRMMIGALRVNRQQQHFLNGTLESRLRVASRNVGALETLVRVLDETSGSCSISQLPAGSALEQAANEREILVLEFGSERVHLASAFFEPFEKGANEFERIQEFSEWLPNGELAMTAVYESHFDQLELNDRLKGEGFLLKTFHRAPSGTKTLDLFHYHTGFELEVIILNQAHLRLRVSGLQFGECRGIIRAARAQECFMDEQDSASTAFDQSASHAHLQHHFESATQHKQRLRTFRLKFEPQEGELVTVEQFDEQMAQLENDFMRLLLSSPGQVPAMQLGHFRLLFGHRDSSIWAHFNLLEPVSLRHTFHLLEGQAIRQQPRGTDAEVTGELVATSSLAKCADLCEKQQRNQAGRRQCVAFSYCRDRSCQTLMGPTRNLSEFKSKWLAPNLQTDQNCRVFHGDFPQLASTRRRVDDLVEFVHQQQGGRLLTNKFVLSLRLENNKTAKFIASRLDETTTNEKQPFGGDQLDSIGDQFALIKKDCDLQASDLQKHSQYLASKVVHAETVQSCQSACEPRSACLLVSYCKSTQICTLVTNMTNWDEYRNLINFNLRDKQNSCSVYSHNFLADFELFEGSREPKKYAERALNFRLEECAAYCQLAQADLKADCLSFDFCQSPGEGAVCYLQTMHLIMSDFDESVLEQTDPDIIRAQLNGRWRGLKKPTFCSHYSRSLVADFALKEGSKFIHHKSIVFQGTQLEQCALICRRDETCLAFEYCHLKGSRVNTCYLERKQTDADGAEVAQQIQQREDSSECNVYELKRNLYGEDKALAWQLDLNLASLNDTCRDPESQATNTNSHFFDSLLVVCASAIIAGILLGFFHARTAQPPRVGVLTRRRSAAS